MAAFRSIGLPAALLAATGGVALATWRYLSARRTKGEGSVEVVSAQDGGEPGTSIIDEGASQVCRAGETEDGSPVKSEGGSTGSDRNVPLGASPVSSVIQEEEQKSAADTSITPEKKSAAAAVTSITPEERTGAAGTSITPEKKGAADTSITPEKKSAAAAGTSITLEERTEAAGTSITPEKKGAAVTSITPEKKGAAVTSITPEKKGAAVTSITPEKKGAAVTSITSEKKGAAVTSITTEKRTADAVTSITTEKKGAPAAVTSITPEKSVEAAGPSITSEKKSAEAALTTLTPEEKSAAAAGTSITPEKSVEAAGPSITSEKKSAEAALTTLTPEEKSAAGTSITPEKKSTAVTALTAEKSASPADTSVTTEKSAAVAGLSITPENIHAATVVTHVTPEKKSSAITSEEKSSAGVVTSITTEKKHAAAPVTSITLEEKSTAVRSVTPEEESAAAEVISVIQEEKRSAAAPVTSITHGEEKSENPNSATSHEEVSILHQTFHIVESSTLQEQYKTSTVLTKKESPSSPRSPLAKRMEEGYSDTLSSADTQYKEKHESCKQVLVLGLDGSGKTSVLNCISANKGKLITTPTEGVNAMCISNGNSKMEFLEIGGSEHLRPYWKMYLSRAFAVIFVVDSADHGRLSLAKRHLHQLIQQDPVLPLIVLANKQDLQNAHHIPEIHDALALSEICEKRKLFLIGTYATKDGSEISSGIQDTKEFLAQLLLENSAKIE